MLEELKTDSGAKYLQRWLVAPPAIGHAYRVTSEQWDYQNPNQPVRIIYGWKSADDEQR